MTSRIPFLAALLAATPAVAAPQTLYGTAVIDALSGRTLNLDTPLGEPLPVTLEDGGALTGKAGALEFYLGSPKDQGIWWLKGSKLCLKWNRWLDGAENCMRIKQDGDMLSWTREDGITGTAKLMPDTRPKSLLPGFLTASLAPKKPTPYALGGPPAQTADVEPAAPITAANTPRQALATAAIAAPVPITKRERVASLEPEPFARPKRTVTATVTATAANDERWALDRIIATEFAVPRFVTDIVRAHVEANLDAGWCRDKTPSDDRPGLFRAAASALSNQNQNVSSAACAGTLPTLQELAKLLITAPQIPE